MEVDGHMGSSLATVGSGAAAAVNHTRALECLAARILFVDDEPSLRDTFEFVLARAGHEVSTAQDGLDALRLLTTQPVDIVVLDLFMPNQDGLGTLLELKRRPHPPIVIAISGNSLFDMDFLGAAKKLGADYALAKPFTPKQLLAVIEHCVGEQAAQGNPLGGSGHAFNRVVRPGSARPAVLR